MGMRLEGEQAFKVDTTCGRFLFLGFRKFSLVSLFLHLQSMPAHMAFVGIAMSSPVSCYFEV